MFASREVDTPEALLRSVDRMLPMVRLFRHGDGTLSHFNGMGVTAADHLATLLTYDDMRSQPIHHAPHSGYERLEAGRTLVVADVGAPPPRPLSQEASAGCLSFEFSSAAQRIVVNCGMPQIAAEPIIQASRSTAAHSTASINDISSCQIVDKKGSWLQRRMSAWLLRRVGPVILSGPERVTAERTSGNTHSFSAPATTATRRASASPTSGVGSSRPRVTCSKARIISGARAAKVVIPERPRPSSASISRPASRRASPRAAAW